MKLKIWIVSSLAFSFAVLVAQCKSTREYPSGSDLKDIETKQDVNLRINPPLWRAQIVNNANNSEQWNKYRGDEFFPGEKVYASMWARTSNFVTSTTGDLDDKSSLMRKNFRVRFYLSVKNRLFGEAPAVPKTIDCKTTDCSSLNIVKSCADVAKTPDVKVATYDLCAYKQPVLVRNFLILSRLGYFDGRELAKFSRGTGSIETSQLMVAGNPVGKEDPFFYAPDPIFTNRELRINSEIFAAGTPITQRSGGDENNAGMRQAPLTRNGSLVALAFNVSAGDQFLRKAYAYKFGFAEFFSAVREGALKFDKNTDFPIPFGYRRREPGQNRLNGEDFRDLGGQLQANKSVKIECVEILEPKESPVFPQWAVYRMYLEKKGVDPKDEEKFRKELEEEIKQGVDLDEFDFRDVADLVDCDYNRSIEDQ